MSAAKSANINYITIEDPASGLFQTQVLDVLCNTSTLLPGKITLCVFLYPWQLLTKRRRLLEVSKKCETADIRLRLYPLLFPVKYSLITSFAFNLTFAWLATIAKLIPKCDIAHCRGYFSTFMGLRARVNCRVVFDMRSSWVDENIAAGRLRPYSPPHAKWLKLERFCLHDADCVLGVSEAMAAIAYRGPPRSYQTIPIAANSALVGFSKSFRSRMRRELGWDRCHVAVYAGSFGLHKINLSVLTQLIKLLGRSENNLRFLFLTSEDPKLIKAMLREAGIAEKAAKFFAVPHDKLGDYLSIADFGIHALPLQPDSETRLGTKVVEYWMNGLPTLVTSAVGAAAKTIGDFGVGQVIQNHCLEGMTELESVDVSALTRDNFSSAMAAFNTNRFDVQSVATAHVKVYEVLLRSPISSIPNVAE